MEVFDQSVFTPNDKFYVRRQRCHPRFFDHLGEGEADLVGPDGTMHKSNTTISEAHHTASLAKGANEISQKARRSKTLQRELGWSVHRRLETGISQHRKCLLKERRLLAVRLQTRGRGPNGAGSRSDELHLSKPPVLWLLRFAGAQVQRRAVVGQHCCLNTAASR